MQNEVVRNTSEKMVKSVDALKLDLTKIRTGRASLSLLDDITVDAYGSTMPVNQLATLTIPESRLIVIQPWDPQVLGPIEKAILKSDLGLTPVNDGKLIRISIPQLTEERRREMVKRVKKIAEEYRVAIRNLRRESNDALKKQKENKEISEDEMFKLQDEVQNVTDRFVKNIDEIAVGKEKEVMEV
jgi:ribosome recycling factor